MATKPLEGITYSEADTKIAAFDEWLETQSEPVKAKVYLHIGALNESIPNMGEKSAKILLIEIYMLARRRIHIEKKYGELEL